jgi:hypothetical protein
MNDNKKGSAREPFPLTELSSFGYVSIMITDKYSAALIPYSIVGGVLFS